MPKSKIKINNSKKTGIQKKPAYFIHPTVLMEDDVVIGAGTKIWHFSQIRHNTKIGKDCVIANSVFIDTDSEIGNNVKIQNHSIIYHKAIIEDGVFIGPNVCFTNDKHPRAINVDGSLKDTEDWEVSTMRIGTGSSIGAHSVITPGVTIGKFAMAGSGSVITKDVPDFALVYGNPARIRGFVCKCGKKIKQYEEGDEGVIGKCDCGLEVIIDRVAYKSLTGEEPKRRIWLR